MDFRLTDEQRLVRDNARDFVDRELIPHVREWEEKGEIPKAFYRKMAGLGFLGAPVPEKYGGGGGGDTALSVCSRGSRGRSATKASRSSWCQRKHRVSRSPTSRRRRSSDCGRVPPRTWRSKTAASRRRTSLARKGTAGTKRCGP